MIWDHGLDTLRNILSDFGLTGNYSLEIGMAWTGMAIMIHAAAEMLDDGCIDDVDLIGNAGRAR